MNFHSYQDPVSKRTYCKACKCFLTLGDDTHTFMRNLSVHVNGRRHRNFKLIQRYNSDDSYSSEESYDYDSNSPEPVFEWEEDFDLYLLEKIGIIVYDNGRVYCNICKCDLPQLSDSKSANVHNIKTHITGRRHEACASGRVTVIDNSSVNQGYKKGYIANEQVGVACNWTNQGYREVSIQSKPVAVNSNSSDNEPIVIDKNVLNDFSSDVPSSCVEKQRNLSSVSEVSYLSRSLRDTTITQAPPVVHKAQTYYYLQNNEFPLVNSSTSCAKNIPSVNMPAAKGTGASVRNTTILCKPAPVLEQSVSDWKQVELYFQNVPEQLKINKRIIIYKSTGLLCYTCNFNMILSKTANISKELVDHFISDTHLSSLSKFWWWLLDADESYVKKRIGRKVKKIKSAIKRYKSTVLAKIVLQLPKELTYFNINHFVEFVRIDYKSRIIKCIVCEMLFEVTNNLEDLRKSSLFAHMISVCHAIKAKGFNGNCSSDSPLVSPFPYKVFKPPNENDKNNSTNNISPATAKNMLNFAFINLIPKYLSQQKGQIDFHSPDFVCKACRCKIGFSRDVDELGLIVKNHLLSALHKDRSFNRCQR